jgi:hypothetical protein
VIPFARISDDNKDRRHEVTFTAHDGQTEAARLAALVGYRILAWRAKRGFFSRVLHPDARDRVLEAFVTTESAEGEGTTFRVSLPKTPILAAMPSKHAA